MHNSISQFFLYNLLVHHSIRAPGGRAIYVRSRIIEAATGCHAVLNHNASDNTIDPQHKPKECPTYSGQAPGRKTLPCAVYELNSP